MSIVVESFISVILITYVDNIPDKDDFLGTFQQLEQFLDIGIHRDDLTSVIELFNWYPIECEELKNYKVRQQETHCQTKNTDISAICLSAYMP